jgi:hypothetical protein
MAVINPDVAGIMSKAEKNSKYSSFQLELLKSTKKRKSPITNVSAKSPSMKMGSPSTMGNSRITMTQKTKNS